MLLILSIFLSVSLHAGCVTKDEVPLKGRLGKNAPVSWKVRKYTPLKKLGQPYNGWVHVKDMDGDKHWIRQKFFTEKYHCLMVKNDRTPIRIAPSLNSSEKFKEPAEKYETFKFLRAKKGWIEIMDVHGDVGWIKASDVWTD